MHPGAGRRSVGGHSALGPSYFGNLKTWLRGTFHGVSGKHLQHYLDEFTYRFDRRWSEGELFGFVLCRAARGQPFPYHRLVAEAAG